MRALDFAALLPESCAEVLDGMYFVSVLGAAIMPSPVLEQPPAAISFTLDYAGDFAGRFGLSVPAGIARALAANFLGEDDSAVTENQISDVIGELANMLCGSVVSRAAGETTFALSHPQAASNLVLPQPCDALAVEFETDLGRIAAWISIEEAVCRS